MSMPRVPPSPDKTPPPVESSLSTSESSTDTSTLSESLAAVATVPPASSPLSSHGRPPYRRKKSARDLLQDARNAAEHSRIYNLTLDVNNLKQEIRQLQVHQRILEDRARRDAPQDVAAITSILTQYFAGFQHGLRDTHSGHCDFVRSIASEQFTIGTTAHGVDMLLEQWRRYSEVFAVRTVELRSATAVPLDGGVIFKCATRFHGSLTRLAVDTVFPNARTRLWQLLHVLGAELAIPMLFHVYFDSHGRLVRQDLDADFFTAIVNLPGGGNVLAVSFLDGASVGGESMIESPQVRC